MGLICFNLHGSHFYSFLRRETVFLFFLCQGVDTDERGHIIVDEFQNTSRSGIYAVGDVCGRALLTPGRTQLYPLFVSVCVLSNLFPDVVTIFPCT